ncbi:capsular biosynthesis protein [Parvularcula sp. ZS-1/3]|uniref:Capsular biosynthesis protein n=1 Tax=Parvularcula mediterranea TaxID=2732508 RepID=A0A7Y3W5L6_9PROT|nr:capsular biosynthesis protein [Parvularcula mediterranea]NNU16749.1 capsular biosynthesis protein [Parvularcula mediterranea]
MGQNLAEQSAQLGQGLDEIDNLIGRKFLLLQGPFGPFYLRLAEELQRFGAEVAKVNLTGADVWGWNRRFPAVEFKEGPEAWSGWLAREMEERGITDVIMHSDCQAYHRMAVDVAGALGVRVFVTEQGYLRPHWITFERGGVNANSALLKEFEAIKTFPALFASRKKIATPTGKHTRAYVIRTTVANLALYFHWHRFPKYKNAFSYAPWKQCVGHIRRYVRNRMGFRKKSLAALNAVTNSGDPFYVALLQRPGDSQIYKHSRFKDLGAFCEATIESFANCAPKNAKLVFKAHPLDHDLDDHRQRISDAAKQYRVEDRVVYVDGGVLGQILPQSVGAITINSTAGLTAVEMGCPTIALGNALYDGEGLTHQGPLDQFWNKPQSPDPALVRRFIGYLLVKTQINGDFSTDHGMRMAIAGIIGGLIYEGALDGQVGECVELPLQQANSSAPAHEAARRAAG